MKLIKQVIFTVATTLAVFNVYGQANPFINVLPSNAGIVGVGATINIEVTIGNTGPISDIPQAKLRPIIQVPPSVTFLPTAQQTGLPAGWTILSNSGTQLRVCNSTDAIPVNTSRTIILKVQGVTVTGPQTFSGNINFGNGTTCGAGPTVAGDLITDNSATSTIEVVPGFSLPLILSNFSVRSESCTAYLTWSTSSETNTDKFEIEKLEVSSEDWNTIGSVPAHGNSSNSNYSYSDYNILNNNSTVLYRLKMIDVDGAYLYSPVVKALLNCDVQDISVFPNPVTNGNLNVSVTSKANLEAMLNSVTGQLIKKINLKDGINNLDVSELSNGVYILSIKFANGDSQNLKVRIQK